jgi:hypothetical protein
MIEIVPPRRTMSIGRGAQTVRRGVGAPPPGRRQMAAPRHGLGREERAARE